MLNIHSVKNYFFNKEGDIVNNIINYWEHTLFISTNYFFPGISGLKNLNFIS
jgi:hypothetical protein